jgi:pSer/pThr/pTyr-binding forkhead associated (FHA) protein
MFKLVISDDEGKTTVVPLVRDEITIGRKEGNTIRLTERNVSRRHARLRKADGAYVLEDLGSYNGVRVNGRRIESESTTPLQPGDQVVIGDYVIALQSEAGDSVASVGASSEPTTPARLVMLTPPAPGAEFALSRNGMRIGRAEDLDIWINHRSISREHAVVHVEGDVFRVTDSESANGMRLNGREVKEAVLTNGDVLELGQVRFRFVPAGEIYVFDADRTVQMDAVVLPDEKPSRTPVIAAVLIVLVAVVVGAVIAWSGDPTPPPTEVIDVRSGSEGTSTPPDPNAARVTPAEAASQAVAECERHLESEEFARASAAATRAMELDPASATARACRDRAAAAARALETFERGRVALEAGDADAAYFAFEELPSDSPFRARPEIAAARQAFVDSHLNAAREATDPAEAIRHANAVLTTPELSADARREAQNILRNAQRRAPNVAVAPTMRSTSMTSSMTSETPTMVEAPTMTETPAMEAAPAGGCDPAVVLRGCNYEQRCVAGQLRGCNDVRSLGVLVEAYKAIGDNAAAERTMRQIVTRFPTSRQAAQYRRQLGE